MDPRSPCFLTVIQSFDRGELFLVLFHGLRKAPQELGASGAGRVQSPHGIECLLCGLHGELDICFNCLRNLRDELAVCWR